MDREKQRFAGPIPVRRRERETQVVVPCIDRTRVEATPRAPPFAHGLSYVPLLDFFPNSLTGVRSCRAQIGRCPMPSVQQVASAARSARAANIPRLRAAVRSMQPAAAGPAMVPPPLPLTPDQLSLHRDFVWKDGTSEFRRKALGETLPAGSNPPADFYMLSPEQQAAFVRHYHGR